MDALLPLCRELFTFDFGQEIVATAAVSETVNARNHSSNNHSFKTPIKLRGMNITADGRNPSADAILDGKLFCKIKLQIPGIHNLKNALAATAAAITLGLPAAAIEQGLYSYTGAGRRLEFKGVCNGAHVYDDYAHHPKELHATLDAVSDLGYDRVILVFQPHTFSRTKALFHDFVEELSRPDIIYLAEIYAAREKNDISISSGVLADSIPGARCLPTFPELAGEINAIAREGDIILTVGAGDIYKVGEMLIS